MKFINKKAIDRKKIEDLRIIDKRLVIKPRDLYFFMESNSLINRRKIIKNAFLRIPRKIKKAMLTLRIPLD